MASCCSILDNLIWNTMYLFQFLFKHTLVLIGSLLTYTACSLVDNCLQGCK